MLGPETAEDKAAKNKWLKEKDKKPLASQKNETK